MQPRIITPLLFAALFGVMACYPTDALAITVSLAEVQDGRAVVKGRKAAANQEIRWEGIFVATADRRGKFSFEGAIPSDCIGTLSDGVNSIEVELSNCDSGPEEPIPELFLYAEQPAAHGGATVRAVGFRNTQAGGIAVVSGGEDAMLRSWAVDLNEQSPEYLDHVIYDLEASADGSVVATGEGGWNGGTDTDTLRIWGQDGWYAGTRAPIGYVYCVAVSPDNRWVAASGFYGDIVVYEASSTGLDLYATRRTKKKRTKALAFSPDGATLASTSTAGRIQLWSFPQESCSSQSCELDLLPVSMSHSGSWTFPVAFSPLSTPNRTEIVSGTDSGTIKVWRIENLSDTPPDVSVLAVDSDAVYSLAWSPDGSRIVAGGNGGLTVYDAVSLEILFQNVGAHGSRVNGVAFSPDGAVIASGGGDGALKLWGFVAQ